MYEYIKGPVVYKNPAYLVVEAGGIGYHIHISLYTYAKVEKLEEARILTYLHVREDTHSLFGFFDEQERQVFLHLIAVSGIGTNTARIILSSMTPEDIQSAIISQNAAAFKHVKGVGPKTAQQIILDLKDKMSKLLGSEAGFDKVGSSGTVMEEAFAALLALGFARPKIQQVIQKLSLDTSEQSVEVIIKQAIKMLAG